MTYDDAGRLISRLSDNPYSAGITSGVEYTYNSDGTLAREFIWEGGCGEDIYEYDLSGKRIRKREKNDTGSTITEYSYDKDGILESAVTTITEEWNGYSWIETTTYSYDDLGRCVKELCTGGVETCTVYDYSYKPFVISEYTIISSSDSYFWAGFQDEAGYTLFSLSLFSSKFFADDDGYLVKVVDKISYSDEVLTYVFSYDSN